MADNDAAQARAKRLNRPLFLHYRSTKPRQADEEVLSNPKILEMLEDSFVAVARTDVRAQ